MKKTKLLNHTAVTYFKEKDTFMQLKKYFVGLSVALVTGNGRKYKTQIDNYKVPAEYTWKHLKGKYCYILDSENKIKIFR